MTNMNISYTNLFTKVLRITFKPPFPIHSFFGNLYGLPNIILRYTWRYFYKNFSQNKVSSENI